MEQLNQTGNPISGSSFDYGRQRESFGNSHRAPAKDRPEKVYPPYENESVEPLPESTRPRKDGPGGD